MMDLGSELELSSFRDPSLNHNTVQLSITGVRAETSSCVLFFFLTLYNCISFAKYQNESAMCSEY